MRSQNVEAIAAQHLALCRRERLTHQDAYYVRLAFTYGLSVAQIAEYADLSFETVQEILAES